MPLFPPVTLRFALPLLLLFLSGSPALGQADSLRRVIEQTYESGADKLPLRALVATCAGEESCLEQEAEWIGGIHDSLTVYYWASVGSYFQKEPDPERCAEALRRAVRLSYRYETKRERAYVYNQLGHLFLSINVNLDSASHYLYRSVNVWEGKPDYTLWMPNYNLSIMHGTLGNRAREIEHMERAYAYVRPGNVRMDYGFVLYHLVRMGLREQSSRLLDRYLPEYREFMETAKSFNPQHDAVLQFVLNDDTGFEGLLRYATERGGRDSATLNLGIVYSMLGGGYQKRGDYDAALRYYQKAVDLDVYDLQKSNLLKTYQSMAELGKEMNDPALVAYALEQKSAIRDSLNKSNFEESLSRLEVEFQTESARAALAENELKLAETRRQRNFFLLSGLLLACLLLAGYLAYRNRLQMARARDELQRIESARKLEDLRRRGELENLRSMIEGQESERQRIARELHDGLGGLLTTVRAHISRLPAADDAERLIDRACTSVRRIAHDMVPQSLSLIGLEGSLDDLARQLRIQGFIVDLETAGPISELDLSTQRILLRTVQELTHNVSKHAQATTILIQLLHQGDRLLLTIEDDGKGFNLQHSRQNGQGLGLNSVEQRVDYLQGSLLFDSSPGKGTTVNIEVPVDTSIHQPVEQGEAANGEQVDQVVRHPGEATD